MPTTRVPQEPGRRTAVVPRCRAVVNWYELDLTARCQRPDGHAGDHCDGLWWFDDIGLRVDGAPHDRRELVGAARRAAGHVLAA